MANKMLIDASHPEETRVVVVRGSRIEEFDFESEHKKQLKGNIYLAKVTRVEPSLQAAFVEYGGNRHGFLAFSEIHPDYYQIPKADREALLAEEMARGDEDDDDEPKAKPAPKAQRGRGRTRGKAAAREDGETIADVLRSVGYTTGLSGKWHVGYDRQRQPRQQGRPFLPWSDPAAERCAASPTLAAPLPAPDRPRHRAG